MRFLQLLALLAIVGLANGCATVRSIEQWKCDNWGMCHFATQRPAVYSPMAVQPGYAPVPSVAPAPAMTYGQPAYAGVPSGYATAPAGTMVPGTSNCSSCQK
ncbi:MAG: hypothetical protein FJ308_05095 [Planctomycetes bacterium]|nr:hypothetical protein [Planctomycetota bacterium]